MTKQERKEIFSALFIGTTVFRLFLIVLIVTFVSVRTHGDLASVFCASVVSSLIIISDSILTLERIFRPDLRASVRIGKIIKLAIIAALLAYSISIWLRFFYWPYAGFAIFVAALYASDFFVERYVRIH